MERPDKQSAAIDRVIWSRSHCPPLVHNPGHSIFPVECVVGGIEVTMALNATKLRTDVSRLAAMREMRQMGFLTSVPGSTTRATIDHKKSSIAFRTFIIGYPSDSMWKAQTIAETFFDLQRQFKTTVHGLYVLGIGFFRTLSPDAGSKEPVRIGAYQGDDLLTEESTKYPEPSIEDYADKTRATVTAWKGMNGMQPGDPAKLAKALIQLAGMPSRRCAGPPAPMPWRPSNRRLGSYLRRPTLTGNYPPRSGTASASRAEQKRSLSRRPISRLLFGPRH